VVKWLADDVQVDLLARPGDAGPAPGDPDR
jgi:hypothetical protein